MTTAPSDRHCLADHLRGTAELARTFGDAFGAGDLTWYLGLTHDVGKGTRQWQQALLAVGDYLAPPFAPGPGQLFIRLRAAAFAADRTCLSCSALSPDG